MGRTQAGAYQVPAQSDPRDACNIMIHQDLTVRGVGSMMEVFDTRVDEKNKAIVSRIIKDTREKGFIKIENESVGVRARRYVPYWA